MSRCAVLIVVVVALGAAACGGSGDEAAIRETATSLVETPAPPDFGLSAGVAAEAADDPSLPGEYIDLPAIYGGPYPATAGHVQQDVDYTEQGLPPAGGPHWGGTCAMDPQRAPPFCGPAPWGIYRQPWEPETLVHNMEHGGVVIWYHTDDRSIIDELEGLAVERLNQGELLVLTPYPDLPEEHIALTAWSRRDLFPVSQYSRARVERFIDTHLLRFNPEAF